MDHNNETPRWISEHMDNERIRREFAEFLRCLSTIVLLNEHIETKPKEVTG